MVEAGTQFRSRELFVLKLSVLAVPDCPNVPVLLERLGLVLAEYPDAA
jgi:hypothetical protein